MALEKPLVVVSDIHLARGGSPALAASLERLLRMYAGHEIVLNGDTFTLSLDPVDRLPGDSVHALLAGTSLRNALRQHVVDGGRLTFIAGNHDALLFESRSKGAVAAALDVTADAPVELCPWFIRRGSVHVEHGHVFDPDNAPTHPLAPWSPATEPLGIALTRRFIAPTGALMFVHAHETTPLAGLTDTLRTFGPRAPRIIARYFWTAGSLCLLASRTSDSELEHRIGSALLPGFATAAALSPSAVETILSSRTAPTHRDARRTFMRLYFDRVLATLAGSAGAVALVTGNVAGGGVLAVAGAYVAFSVSRGTNRYGGKVEHELAGAARLIATETQADHVVFGHTHREFIDGAYVNTGSFGYPRDAGRPYVFVDTDGKAEPRRLHE